MDFNNTVTFPDTIFYQEVDNEMVLLDMESENYFGLDEVGCDIWTFLKEGKTLQETLDALIEIYDVNPETLKIDLLNFVEQLQKNNLIQLKK